MKKLILALAMLIPATFATLAQEPAADSSQSLTPVEGSFSKFEYQGFSLMVPSASTVDMTTKEAVIKCNDGSFGMSIKVEKDKGASANAATEMCRRMVSELDVKGARITKMLIHGMQGAKLEGVTEGAPITVLILAVDKKYVKIVVINTPDHADWVNITLDSITPLS